MFMRVGVFRGIVTVQSVSLSVYGERQAGAGWGGWTDTGQDRREGPF